jgi:hypothetical protein
MDAVGDEHDPMQTYTSDKHLKPSEKKSATFETPPYDNVKGFRAWTRKILFGDGSTWEDDGSHSCKVDGVH